MINFIRARLYIIIAIGLTALASYTLSSRQAYDSEWMARWNHIDAAQVLSCPITLTNV